MAKLKKAKKRASKPARKAPAQARKKPPAKKSVRQPVKKPAPKAPRKSASRAGSALPASTKALIAKAWPEHVVDFSHLDFESSYLAPLVDGIRAGFRDVDPTCVVHEKKPIVAHEWMADDAVDLP